MARLFVEGWAPEYGTPLEHDQELSAAAHEIHDDVEVPSARWEGIDGRDDGRMTVAFVDGVRRVDARLTVDDPEAGPIPGICGTYAVGSVVWDRSAMRSEIGEVRIGRLAVLADGRGETVPPAGLLSYRTEAIVDADPARLIAHFHTRMRQAEAALAASLAGDGHFVIADGPINELAPRHVVGYIKTHRVSYLPADRQRVVGELAAGQRTPLFVIAATRFQRYSWYMRLAAVDHGHSWSGVVRCEAAAALPLDDARRIADRTAALLPMVASEPQVEPRAPQNLVPIAALERELRRRMGDPQLVFRELRAAVTRGPA